VKILGSLIIKNYLPIQFVENIWLKCLVIWLCFQLVFPFEKTLIGVINFFPSFLTRYNEKKIHVNIDANLGIITMQLQCNKFAIKLL
jgi:hypothetical protein